MRPSLSKKQSIMAHIFGLRSFASAKRWLAKTPKPFSEVIRKSFAAVHSRFLTGACAASPCAETWLDPGVLFAKGILRERCSGNRV